MKHFFWGALGLFFILGCAGCDEKAGDSDNTNTDSNSTTGSHLNTDSISNTGSSPTTDSNSTTDSSLNTDSVSNTDSNSDTDTVANSDTGSNTDSDTVIDADSDTGTGTVIGPDSDSELDTDFVSEWDFDDLKSTPQQSNPRVVWQNFGPGLSGYIDQFYIHDTDPNAMFMELDMGNAHGTWNRGGQWNTIRDWDGPGTNMNGINAIEFSAQDPDFGLVMAKDGIFSSTNRGRTWSYLSKADTKKHSVMTVDPNDDNIWYIGAGQTWQIKMTHYNKNGIVKVDKNHSQGFILKSTDKGKTWNKITAGISADADFSKIIVDPENSQNVYASCQHGVFSSTNGGNNWQKVPGNGLPHNQPRDMVSYYDKSTKEFILYIVEITHYNPDGNSIKTTGGVYRSADGGTNWENLTGNLAIDLTKISQSGYISKYWRAIAYWLNIDQNQAKSNYPNLPTATFSQFHRIAVDPTNKDRIYLVHNFKHDYSFPPGNIWMTEDGGKNWIAAAREGVYWKNEKDKAYWQSRNNPLGINTKFAHVEREHQETDNTQSGPRFVFTNSIGEVYTAFSQQIMRSTDNGKTWNQIDDYETAPGNGHWVGSGDSNLPGESICLDTQTPGYYLWGSGEHGLWRNTDDGDLVYPGAIPVEQLMGQSKKDSHPKSIGTIAVNPKNPKQIFTLHFRQTARGQLYRTDNDGDTWQSVSNPVDFGNMGDNIGMKQYTLRIDFDNPDNMYFTIPRSVITPYNGTQWTANGSGFSNYGIYRSTNAGKNWSISQNGIPNNKSILHLAIDPGNAKTVYAAANKSHDGVNGGLYKTTNGGDSWSSVNLPSGMTSLYYVEVSKLSGDLYSTLR